MVQSRIAGVLLSAVFACTVALGLSLMGAGKAVSGTRLLKESPMKFEACLLLIRVISSRVGVAPINIVGTSILRIVRFPANDGSGKSVLITCSKPDARMLVNESWPE